MTNISTTIDYKDKKEIINAIDSNSTIALGEMVNFTCNLGSFMINKGFYFTKKEALEFMKSGKKVQHVDWLDDLQDNNPTPYYYMRNGDIYNETNTLVTDWNSFASNGMYWRVLDFKTYRVPFQTREEVWIDNIAEVEAIDANEAYALLEEVIKTSGVNPYSEYNSEWVGINQGIDSVNETFDYYIGDKYNSGLQDVEEHFTLPLNSELSSYKQAEQAPKKTINLEIAKESLDIDIISILEGLDPDNEGYSFSGKKMDQYRLKTLTDTLNPDFDEDYEDFFGEKWKQFVGYCKQEMVDYVTLTTNTNSL